MRASLGDAYVETLFQLYRGRVPPEADLVTYWFEKARAQIEAAMARRVGLVATNSIRGGANRRVLARVAETTRLFEAWSDEPWIVEGAAVRVSLVCFGEGDGAAHLDGLAVPAIHSDLTGGGLDLTVARRLRENVGVAFMGDTKGGAFDIPGDLARTWLTLPLNPNGRPNSDVLRPWVNGLDVTRRPRDMWIVDFGWEMSEAEAALYEAPFEFAFEHIRTARVAKQSRGYAKAWWRHERPRPEMWSAIWRVARAIATPRVAKHRLFCWLDQSTLADSATIAIARDDDTTFGILHSRFHEAWSLRLGTWLGKGNDPRYTPTTTFETFPFPEGLTPDIPAAAYADDPNAIAIAGAARELDRLRRAWLNPPDLVDIVPEVVPTAAPGEEPVRYPDHILPKNAAAAAELKTRTLTNLYNRRPQWLADAHARLDAAVAAAYGFPADLSEEDALARLLEMNLARAARGA